MFSLSVEVLLPVKMFAREWQCGHLARPFDVEIASGCSRPPRCDAEAISFERWRAVNGCNGKVMRTRRPTEVPFRDDYCAEDQPQ
jgi:hypothetical protein